MKKHYAWVDVAKGIGIVFIVLGHAANTGNVKDYLFSFHIPMLLMLSGIVFSTRDSFIEFTKSRLKRIVVPYFVFSFISIMIFKIIGILKPSITDGMNTDVITNVGVMLWGNSKPDCMKYNSPLWYLPCLFVVLVLSYGIEIIIDRLQKVNGGYALRACIIALCILYTLMVSPYLDHNPVLPWHIETSINLLAFFQVGCALQLLIPNFYRWAREHNKNLIIAAATLFIVIGGLVAAFNTRVDIRLDSYGNVIAYYVAAFCSSIGWIMVAVAIDKNNVFERLGAESLAIMLLHKFPLLLFQKVVPFTKLYLNKPNSILGIICIIASGIITVILCHIAAMILSKYIPWTIGCGKGRSIHVKEAK